MHPPLFRPHPDCQDMVENLVNCHKEHNIAKFVGACNQFKADLDQCFRKEKEAVRRKNFEEAHLNNDQFMRINARMAKIAEREKLEAAAKAQHTNSTSIDK